MHLPFNIARRYFFSRNSAGRFNLITLISGISLLGYMVGSAALVIVLSVFNGFGEMFAGIYNNFDSDLQVVAREGKVFNITTADLNKINQIQGIEKTSQVLEENVLLKYNNRQNLAKLKGVDEHYPSMASLDSCIVSGLLLLQSHDSDFAVLGQGIAYQLGVDPSDIFHRLVVYVPKRGSVDVLNPEGMFTKAALLPSGIFAVQEEVDNKYVLVPLRFLKNILQREDEISSLEIKLAAKADEDHVKKALQNICGEPYRVLNRFEQREGFFKVMQSEKLISYFILFFILLVAASNSIGSLYILVIEKKKDIQLFSALGLNQKSIHSVFVYEGLLLAVTGGVIGICLGVGLCYAQEQYGLIRLTQSAAFISTAYPVSLKALDVTLVFFTVLLLGYITSLYPAYKAGKILAH